MMSLVTMRDDGLGPGALHSAGFRSESQTLSLNHLDLEQGANTCKYMPADSRV